MNLIQQAQARYDHLFNPAMARLLASGQSLDVSVIGHLLGGDVDDVLAMVYELREPPREGFDYCDATTWRWIWSVGVEVFAATCGYLAEVDEPRCAGVGCHGRILAATDGRMYRPHQVELPRTVCLWLR